MIPVTRPYLPSRKNLDKYINRIYGSNWLTNNGPLVKELTARLEEYLGVRNLLLVANGTLALQIAYRALGVNDENGSQAITTPFSFVATASSLQWEGIAPVFSDIDAETFCISPGELPKELNSSIRAIVPVHVFGNACDVDAIERFSKKNDLVTIFDAAHAFGVSFKGRSIMLCGDASILSFHATKLFHSIEGGAVIFKNPDVLERAKLLINFGIDGPDSVVGLGINAKMNEFQAAMGLSVLDDMGLIMEERSCIWNFYKESLVDYFQLQRLSEFGSNNYAYFPILFDAEEQLLVASAKLNEVGVQVRRYFKPSLDTLDYIESKNEQPVSRSISNRILCLPIYNGLARHEQALVIKTLLNAGAKF